MNLGDIIRKDGIIQDLKAADKKQALFELAQHANQLFEPVDTHDVFNALLQRERLSSTGLGRGIAIPHVKVSGLDGIHCIFGRLEKPVPYDSHDNEPVDLLFFLMAPEDAGGDHLRALARISRLVRENNALQSLRDADSVDDLHHVLTAPLTSNAA